jgi:hypothetical protein
VSYLSRISHKRYFHESGEKKSDAVLKSVGDRCRTGVYSVSPTPVLFSVVPAQADHPEMRIQRPTQHEPTTPVGFVVPL